MSVAHEPNELRRILARAKRVLRSTRSSSPIRDPRAGGGDRRRRRPGSSSSGPSASTSRTPASIAATRRWSCPRDALYRDHSPHQTDLRQSSPRRSRSPAPSTSSSSPSTTPSRLSSATCAPRAASLSSPRSPAQLRRGSDAADAGGEPPRSTIAASISTTSASRSRCSPFPGLWAPTRCSEWRWRAPERSAASATTFMRLYFMGCSPRASGFPEKGCCSPRARGRQVLVRRRGQGHRRGAAPSDLRDAGHRGGAPRDRHRLHRRREERRTGLMRTALIDQGRGRSRHQCAAGLRRGWAAGWTPHSTCRGRCRRPADHRPPACAGGSRGPSAAQAG